VVTPQVWLSPAEIVAQMREPVTATGDVRIVPELPSPICPLGLSPQQYAAPAVVTAQVNAYPAVIVAKVRAPDTSTGV